MAKSCGGLATKADDLDGEAYYPVSPNWWTAYISMLLLATLSPAVRPSAMELLNRMVPGGIRATLLSTQNVAMTVFIAVMHPAVGRGRYLGAGVRVCAARGAQTARGA